MKETLRHISRCLNTLQPTRLPPFLGIPWFKDLNYMQNNRERSDFADAHTDFPQMDLDFWITKTNSYLVLGGQWQIKKGSGYWQPAVSSEL